MKKHLAHAASLSTALLLTTAAVQAEIGISPRVNAGFMDYSYNLGINGGSWHGVSDVVGILGVGATVSMDRFFVDVYAQTAAEGDGTYDYVYVDPPINGNPMTFDREDYAVSLGYAVHENLSFFAGYKWGNTDFDEGFNPQTGGGFIQRFSTEFKENGPFVGAAMGFPLGNGLLALNFALAFLDADNSQLLVEQNGVPTNEQFASFTGDTTGVNIGVSWRAPITDNLSYSVGVDAYRYSFKVDHANFPGYGSGSPEQLDMDIKATEDALALKLGLSYRF